MTRFIFHIDPRPWPADTSGFVFHIDPRPWPTGMSGFSFPVDFGSPA